MDIRPYIVVPKFIEQPTWGGAYIAESKNWQDKIFAAKKIGQSYELYSESLLTEATDTLDPSFEPEFDRKPEHSFALQNLIDVGPEKVLGKNSFSKFGNKVKTLIKFTQAKGNSFQLHVKDGTPNTKWLPKPESWYYLATGLATLGVSNLSKLDDYKTLAQKIALFMDSISKEIHDKKITIEDAKIKVAELLKRENIYQYVNTVEVPKDSIVDIHAGGIHHSWEENDEKYPNGNIVYEVQVEASDDASTLRSFDKGKIKDDGTIRPVQIDDYFKYMDTSKEANDPKNFLKKEKIIEQTSEYVVSEIFNTPYYTMQKIALATQMSLANSDSFHHIFVREGTLLVEYDKSTLTIGTGHSVFIPSSAEVCLTSKNGDAILLSTFI